MKRILVSLSIVSSLFLISCEDEFADYNLNEQNNDVTQNDGYFDITCIQYYDSVLVSMCDSIWVQDSSNFETICETICSLDSNQYQVIMQNCYDLYKPGSWEYSCKEKYKLKIVQECDSVWVDNSDKNQYNNGNWKIECDTVYQGPTLNYEFSCDSVWIPAN